MEKAHAVVVHFVVGVAAPNFWAFLFSFVRRRLKLDFFGDRIIRLFPGLLYLVCYATTNCPQKNFLAFFLSLTDVSWEFKPTIPWKILMGVVNFRPIQGIYSNALS